MLEGTYRSHLNIDLDAMGSIVDGLGLGTSDACELVDEFLELVQLFLDALCRSDIGCSAVHS